MLIHLISDLIKDETLKSEFSHDPISVFERYGVKDLKSIQSKGIEGLTDRISFEIIESIELPSIIGWPNPKEINVANVTPDIKLASDNIGEIEIHGTNFNCIEKDKIENIAFENNNDHISTTDFEIISNKLIRANFTGKLKQGDYNLIAYKMNNRIFFSLKNALIIE